MFRASRLPTVLVCLIVGSVACDSSVEEDAGPGADARVDAAVGRDANDLGVRVDLGVDAGLDGGTPPDAAPSDLGTVDASPFPIRVAYSAAAEDPLLLELYLTDTSTSRAKVTGPMAGGPAGGEKEPETGGLQSFEWSRDGQRLLYRAQQDTFGLTELYVAEAGGTRPGPRRKLSLPMNVSYVEELNSSRVSERVSFLQYDGTQTNLYVVSSTATNPVVRRISQGLPLNRGWSPTADQIAFHDIIQSMNDRDLWFAQVHPGAPPPERVNPGANLGFGGVLAWAPDGSSFIYAADESALRVFELYRVTVTNGLLGTRERLHPAFGPNADIGFDREVGAAFSPDGSKVAYLADPRVAGLDELFVIDLGGGAPSAPITLSSTATPEYFVERFSFDPSGAFIAYVLRELASNPRELFIVNAEGVSPPMPITPPIASGEFWLESWARDGELLVFHFNHESGRSLYAVEPSRSLTPVRISHAPAEGDQGVVYWSLSPDGRRIVYASEEAAGTWTAHIVGLEDVSAPTPQLLSRGTSAPSWCFPPNQDSAVALIADLEVPGLRELYFVPDTDAPTFIKVSGPLVTAGRVSACAFAP